VADEPTPGLRQSRVAEYGLRLGPRESTYTALCADDACPWKHRGVTCEATHVKAEAHVRGTGHSVVVYEETKTRIVATTGNEGLS
jgi:hypothetical protein